MKLFRTMKFMVLFFTLFPNINYAQFIEDYEMILKEDLVDALSFAGVDIIKINLGEVNSNYSFKIIIDEYAGKDNFIKSDTVISHFTEYNKPSKDGNWEKHYIDSLRLISKVLNNSFDKIYLIFSTGPFSVNAIMNLEKKYQKKHYWVKFSKADLIIGDKIPILFYGSEWDDMINGVKVPRFCSKKELSRDLDEETIQFIPHYFIISYKLDEIK